MNVTTAMMRDALREHYRGGGGGEWALAFEVGDATGFDCGGHADAVAISMWPSRGIQVHGHEIKISRADWHRELQNPAKAERHAKFCDCWWLVVGPGILKTPNDWSLVPPAWGVMEWVDASRKEGSLYAHLPGKLAVKRRPPPPAAAAISGPMPRPFMAAFARAVVKADRSEMEALVHTHAEKRVAQERERWERERNATAAFAAQGMVGLAEFLAEQGLSYTNTASVKRAVAFVLKANLSGSYSPLVSILSNVASVASRAEELRTELAGVLEKSGLLPEERKQIADGLDLFGKRRKQK